jgi:hypothetical protein
MAARTVATRIDLPVLGARPGGSKGGFWVQPCEEIAAQGQSLYSDQAESTRRG